MGVIGEGSYGQVLKAAKGRELNEPPWYEAKGPPFFAIKRLKSPAKDTKTPVMSSVSTLREVKLLRELHHPNVVNMTELIVDVTAHELVLVFEYAEWDMMRIVEDHKERMRAIPEFTIKSLLWQSLKGCAYLHSNWVVHRDLKPQNILVTGEGASRGRVCLADFGLARIFKDPVLPLGKVDKIVVTLWYRAPELLLGALDYDTSIDMWSMGCIFADLLLAKERTVRALFQGQEIKPEQSFQREQCDKIFRILGLPDTRKWPGVDSLPLFEHIKPWYDTMRAGYPRQSVLRSRVPEASEAAFDLLSKMLELNPAKRITAEEALKHQYFSQAPLPNDNAVDVPGTAGQIMESLRYPIAPPKPLPVEDSKKQDEMIMALAAERARVVTSASAAAAATTTTSGAGAKRLKPLGEGDQSNLTSTY